MRISTSTESFSSISKLNSSASEAAAAFQTAQADIKAGLDALAVDLPEIPAVNLQSEITSLINDVDRTTVEGIAAFNAKVAALKKDFGGALEKKGLDLDKLIIRLQNQIVINY